MPEIEQIIKDYVFAWNTSDKEERIALMAKLLTEDCLYFDSHLPDAIASRTLHCQFIERFREKFPDLSLQLTNTPDSHHNHFKFSWQMVKSDGNLFTQGDFFGEINGSNQIAKLVGFVD